MMTTEKITALIALLAVVVGPFVAIIVARWQIRATVVSSNRQNWINDLRERISEFITLAHTIIIKRQTMAQTEEPLTHDYHSIYRLSNIIELMLNPKENEHTILLKLILGTLAATSANLETASPVIIKNTEQILVLSKQILKKEWEKVKKGK